MFSHRRHGKYFIAASCSFAAAIMGSDIAAAGIKDTSAEEATCKEIGFSPKTASYADCVMELIGRRTDSAKPVPKERKLNTGLNYEYSGPRVMPEGVLLKSEKLQSQSIKECVFTDEVVTRINILESCFKLYDNSYNWQSGTVTNSYPSNISHNTQSNRSSEIVETSLSPSEQTCVGYGFTKGTAQFSECLMQLDQARQQAQIAQQQYQMQLQQYQQQMAAYQAQQEEIKREKSRRQGEFLMRLSQGLLGGQSFGDASMAASGFTPMQQPVPPSMPWQDFTLRTADGGRASCTYDKIFNEVKCR